MASFERLLVNVNRALISATLFVVFAIVLMNVIGRYGFSHSFPWVEELARHLMVLCVFAGAGLALREGRLVAITIVPDLLPYGLSQLLRWGVVLAMLVFMAVVMWLGIQFVQFGWNKTTMSTGMSRGIPYISIPFGCALFLAHLTLFARRFVRGEFEYGDSGAME